MPHTGFHLALYHCVWCLYALFGGAAIAHPMHGHFIALNGQPRAEVTQVNALQLAPGNVFNHATAAAPEVVVRCNIGVVAANSFL